METALVTLCALGYSERPSIRARPGGVSVLFVSIMKDLPTLTSTSAHVALYSYRGFELPLAYFLITSP